MQYPDNNKSEDSGKNINEDSIGVRNAGPQLRIDSGNKQNKLESANESDDDDCQIDDLGNDHRNEPSSSRIKNNERMPSKL